MRRFFLPSSSKCDLPRFPKSTSFLLPTSARALSFLSVGKKPFLSPVSENYFFNNHSTNRRTRYKGRFPKLRVRVRYALSLAARRRALARGEKRTVFGFCKVNGSAINKTFPWFFLFFNSLPGLYNLLLSLLKRRLAGLSSKGKVSHSRVT